MSGISQNILSATEKLQETSCLLVCPSIDQTYIYSLLKERECIGVLPNSELTKRLIDQEIERIQKDGRISKTEENKMTDVTKDKPIKLSVKVVVPVSEHPKFNFVGKLLGPKGNSLKRLQEETLTKMAILGRGSMRDKQKEEELRLSKDPRHFHLFEDLHVEVVSIAHPAEAHARIAYALTELRRYLVPDYNDDIRQGQMREMQILNKSPTDSIISEPNNNKQEAIRDESQSDESLLNSRLSPNQNPLQEKRRILQAIKKRSNILTSSGISGSRRSVLSLLTKARSIQQKEHDVMKAFPDIKSGFNILDTLSEFPATEVTFGSHNGKNGTVVKSPVSTIRYRFDPYPKVTPSST